MVYFDYMLPLRLLRLARQRRDEATLLHAVTQPAHHNAPILEDSENGDADLGQSVQQKFGVVMMVFMVLFMFLMGSQKANKDDGEAAAPGNICFDLKWDKGLDYDVDLWVRGPDKERVGYTNRSSKLFNLLRDDLGFALDLSGENRETTCSRGVMPGHYVMNAYFFADHRDESQTEGEKGAPHGRMATDTAEPSLGPFQVEGYLSITKLSDLGSRQQIKMKATVTMVNQEVTVMQFDIDDKFMIIPNSINQVHEELYQKASAKVGHP